MPMRDHNCCFMYLKKRETTGANGGQRGPMWTNWGIVNGVQWGPTGANARSQLLLHVFKATGDNGSQWGPTGTNGGQWRHGGQRGPMGSMGPSRHHPPYLLTQTRTSQPEGWCEDTASRHHGTRAVRGRGPPIVREPNTRRLEPAGVFGIPRRPGPGTPSFFSTRGE